jgi:hydrogenase maturation protein HypF
MKRFHIHLTGIVQGVGFRPFVYNLAREFGLTGWVSNTSEGVHIEVEGDFETLKKFAEAVKTRKPPRAEIKTFLIEELPPAGFETFEIRESEKTEEEFVLISPDIATCSECLSELFNPDDRRYRYPFINCTNCGPRFTIIEDIPYDRPKTTMKKFKMCELCQAEYDDPANRRFHAQPNACPECGPELLFISKEEVFLRIGEKGIPAEKMPKEKAEDFGINLERGYFYLEKDNALKAAEKLILSGGVLALKGLGGFHLACLADDPEPVNLLRTRKKRPSKAFAVMFKNVEEAKKAVQLSDEAEILLRSPIAPIILLKKKESETLANNIAPGLSEYGVMLPSTPLHHLLLNDISRPLVMTSGNLSEEPIARDNQEALERLGKIADGFLIHNRDIRSRYDDSVIRLDNSEKIIIRRARSIAPYPLEFPFSRIPSIFASGPELKCTFTLTKDRYAFVSQHIGDLDDELTFKTYTDTVELYCQLFRIKPEFFACDLHPDYLSTRFAEELSGGSNLIKVQHHYAHIASVIGEHNITGNVIGFAFDGTGYGEDGTVWGGEILIAGISSFKRAGRLRLFPLPTGEAAIKKPYRIAAYLLKMLGEDEKANEVANGEMMVIEQLVKARKNAPLTSSMGRLFDAVSVIIGIGSEATYEGELAMRLEAATGIPNENACLELGFYEFSIDRANGDLLFEISWEPILKGILDDMRSLKPTVIAACKFHNTIARIIFESARLLRKETGINRLAFSGGVFQNILLIKLIKYIFANSGFELFFHRELPPNDGCISFGQAVAAVGFLLKKD